MGNLIPDEGNLILDEGNLIPDEGNLIPDEGNLIPDEGNLIPDEGNLIQRQIPTYFRGFSYEEGLILMRGVSSLMRRVSSLMRVPSNTLTEYLIYKKLKNGLKIEKCIIKH